MAAKVFISYRRDDSRYQARMIYHAFERVLGRDGVFMDVDSIPPGANFRRILKDWVDQCDILLALIGAGWIDATDAKTGQRRLDDPSDFVRIEIGEALARDIPVVPVLLDGTPMPEAGRLPGDLEELPDRHAEQVEFRTFDADVARLIRKLRLDGKDGAERIAPSKEAAYRAEGRIKVDAKVIHGAPDGWFKPGAGKSEWFQDHPDGPEMVVVPKGSFMMGSPESEPERESWLKGTESPRHSVTVTQPLAVGRFAVTFDEWEAAVADGGCNGYRPSEQGRGRGKRPVIDVSWDDAQAYVAWLSRKTSKTS